RSVSARRDSDLRGWSRFARGHRSGDEARLRLSDGPVHAARSRRARYGDVRGRGHVRGVPRAALCATTTAEADGDGGTPGPEVRQGLLRLPNMNELYELSDEHRAIRDLARQIARAKIAPLAAKLDETGEYPHEQLRVLGQQGLMGLHIPEEYGGSGAGAKAVCLAAEEVAWACAATATVLLVQNLGGYPISLAGTEDQKRRFLPRLATGEITAAFSLSESGSGSDAVAMQCAAVRKGDRYVVNGSEMWVTNGSHAGVITVFVTPDPAKRAKGVTALPVEPRLKGITLGKNAKKLGHP